MKRPAIGFAALMALSSATTARGQTTPDSVAVGSLKRGDHLRVWAESPRLSGLRVEFSKLDARTLTVSARSSLDTLAGFRPDLPLESLVRIDVQRGRKTTDKYRTTSVLVGALGGAAAGGIFGAMLDSGNPYNEGAGVLVMTPLGGLTGLIVGAIVGARGRPVWAPVALHSR
jgi:hypothetical protein